MNIHRRDKPAKCINIFGFSFLNNLIFFYNLEYLTCFLFGKRILCFDLIFLRTCPNLPVPPVITIFIF